MAKKEKYKEEMKKDTAPVGIPKEIKDEAQLIRILSKDIPGDKAIYPGLTRIKGVSWSISNAVCRTLKIPREKKIEELSKEEIKEIEEFINNPKLPDFLKNRRKDLDSGEDKHLNGADLDLQKEFDIKKLKKIKSYRGIRHSAKLPVRGQRTRSNFRRNRKKGGAVGVKKKSAR